MSEKAWRRRLARVFVVVLFMLTMATSVGTLLADEDPGCCSSQDCEVIPQPYMRCSKIGEQDPKCKIHEDPSLQYCCDFSGWCGPE